MMISAQSCNLPSAQNEIVGILHLVAQLSAGLHVVPESPIALQRTEIRSFIQLFHGTALTVCSYATNPI